MAIILHEKKICSVCGEKVRVPKVAHIKADKEKDADLRPGGVERKTMPYWVQECPSCGYVARRISDVSYATKAYLKQPAYKECEGYDFKSNLAKKFYRYYMIKREAQDDRWAIWGLTCAAWACDDELDDVNARELRLLAAKLIMDFDFDDDQEEEDTQMAVRADLLRRAGKFQSVIDEYGSFETEDSVVADIIKKEIEWAKNNDKKRHSISEIYQFD